MWIFHLHLLFLQCYTLDINYMFTSTTAFSEAHKVYKLMYLMSTFKLNLKKKTLWPALWALIWCGFLDFWPQTKVREFYLPANEVPTRSHRVGITKIHWKILKFSQRNTYTNTKEESSIINTHGSLCLIQSPSRVKAGCLSNN